MVPVFILGVPIFDMTLVVISRIRRGVSPNTAGKDHTSHRLVDRGFSQREAVLILYLMGGVFGMIGLYMTQAELLEAYAMAGLTAVAAIYLIWKLEQGR
jgi:UDP-GlcNAc:undecaprenyl-phosphate GlcNAc-1-phosphate transferase